jgi:hypothetical protein
MKKIALAVLLAFALVPAATFAQVVVRVAPLRRLLSVVLHRLTGAMCGSMAITAGTARNTSGLVAVGIVHRIRARTGLLTAGFAYTTTGK